MSKRTALSTFAAVLCAAVLLSSHAASLPAGPSPTPLASVKQREPHPQINRAIVALETAKLHLRRAAHDFGGHRVAAIAAIDAALVQLKAALEYDKD